MIDCPMELAGSCRMERERKPGAQEIMWHQSNLKRDEKDQKFTAESLWASTFCWRARRYFHSLRRNSSKLSQHCIHVCGTACSTLHCTGQRELGAGSCLTTPAFTITVWLTGRGELRMVWGRNQHAEELLYLGNATEIDITYHPALDHSRRCPASDDWSIWKSSQLPRKSMESYLV